MRSAAETRVPRRHRCFKRPLIALFAIAASSHSTCCTASAPLPVVENAEDVGFDGRYAALASSRSHGSGAVDSTESAPFTLPVDPSESSARSTTGLTWGATGSTPVAATSVQVTAARAASRSSDWVKMVDPWDSASSALADVDGGVSGGSGFGGGVIPMDVSLSPMSTEGAVILLPRIPKSFPLLFDPESPSPIGWDQSAPTPTPTPAQAQDDESPPPPVPFRPPAPTAALTLPPTTTRTATPTPIPALAASETPSASLIPLTGTQTTRPTVKTSSAAGTSSPREAINGGSSGSRTGGSTDQSELGGTVRSPITGHATTAPSLENRIADDEPAPPSSSTPSPIPQAVTASSNSPAMAPSPQSSRRYQRGDDIIQLELSSGSGDTSPKLVMVSPSQSPASVVSGDPALSSTTAQSSVDSDSAVYSFLQYVASIAAFSSLVWLAVSTTLSVSLQSSLLRDCAWPLGDPNQWEFGIFIVYIQGLSSMSQLIVSPAMPSFLLQLWDALSWAAFIPFHGSTNGLNINSRRLDEVVLDGLVAYANRIGLNEVNLLPRIVGGFVVLLGIIVLAFAISLLACRSCCTSGDTSAANPTNGAIETMNPSTSAIHTTGKPNDTGLTTTSVRILAGVSVLVWFFALYPLTMVSTYEIAAEARSTGAISGGSIAIAVIVLLVVIVGGFAWCAANVWVLQTPEQLSARHRRLVWGSLYDGFRIERRLFFGVFAMPQVLRGLIVGTVTNGPLQLALLAAADVSVLVAMVWLQPFAPSTLSRLFAYAVYGLLTVNSALAFTYTSAAAASNQTRRTIGFVVLTFNVVVMLLWFARHFGIICRLVRLTTRGRATHRGLQSAGALVVTPLPSTDVDASTRNFIHCGFHKGGSPVHRSRDLSLSRSWREIV